MIGVSLTIEKVWGMADERGWGFRILLGETSVMKLFSTSYVMNSMLRISLTSFPVNMAFSGSCGKINSVHFLHSNGCISSSSSEFDCVGASLFWASGPELDPTPASLPFLFSILTRKM
jgi:hypothetical protein